MINAWVLSCRAFARRIEHAMLQVLFEYCDAHEAEFCFAATSRNGPVQDFLTDILGSKPDSHVTLTRAQFERNCPQLYHRIRELGGAKANA